MYITIQNHVLYGNDIPVVSLRQPFSSVYRVLSGTEKQFPSIPLVNGYWGNLFPIKGYSPPVYALYKTHRGLYDGFVDKVVKALCDDTPQRYITILVNFLMQSGHFDCLYTDIPCIASQDWSFPILHDVWELVRIPSASTPIAKVLAGILTRQAIPLNLLNEEILPALISRVKVYTTFSPDVFAPYSRICLLLRSNYVYAKFLHTLLQREEKIVSPIVLFYIPKHL